MLIDYLIFESIEARYYHSEILYESKNYFVEAATNLSSVKKWRRLSLKSRFCLWKDP